MKILLFTFSTLISIIYCLTPGIKVAVRQPLLDKAKDTYFPQVIDSILVAPIPNMNQGDMVLKDIKIQELNLDPNNMNLVLKDGFIQVDATKFSIVLTMVGEKKVFGLGFKTNLVASAANSAFSMRISSNYSENKLELKVEEVKVDLNKPDLKCDSFLAEGEVNSMLESGEFEAMFTQTLQDQLKTQAEGTMNSALALSKDQVEISGMSLVVDYSQTQNLKISPEAISSVFEAAIYNPDLGYSDDDIAEIELPDFDPSSPHYVQLFVSSGMLNSAIDELYKETLFSMKITNDMIPPIEQLPLRLDTTSLAPLLPVLIEKYGEQPVYLECYDKADVAPQVQFTNGRIVGLVAIGCDIYVWDGEANWIKGLILNANVEVMAAVGVVHKENQIAITLEKASVKKLELEDPEGNSTPSDMLAPAFNIILDIFSPYTYYVEIPQLSQFTLENPEIKSFDGFLAIYGFGDFKPLGDYKPTPNSNAVESLFLNTGAKIETFLFTMFVVLMAIVF